MNAPPKPFTVAVKRSRSHTPLVKPVVSPPPVFNDARLAPNAVLPSQARQLAERMFSCLTDSSEVGSKGRMSAESAFRAVAPKAATLEPLATEPVLIALETQARPIDEIIPAKPRTGRANNTSTAPVAMSTG